MDLHFDPWKATLEEAVRAQERCADQIDPKGPVYQWCAAQELMEREKLGVKSGRDVLAAVEVCALHALVMPDWLARAYLSRYRKVEHLREPTWDDEAAFGRPYPKGVQVGARRRRRLNRMRVVNAVRAIIDSNPDLPLDSEWDGVGALVAKSGKEAQKLYAEAVNMGLADTIKNLRARRKEKRLPRKSR